MHVGIAGGFVGHILVLVLPHFVRRASIVHGWVASLVRQERHLSIVGFMHTLYGYVVVWCPNKLFTLSILQNAARGFGIAFLLSTTQPRDRTPVKSPYMLGFATKSLRRRLVLAHQPYRVVSPAAAPNAGAPHHHVATGSMHKSNNREVSLLSNQRRNPMVNDRSSPHEMRED